jgi:diaminohydroxyphosphoribosylaminopyrimidine deaminase/5-amino-6-(5-phosphoribosylamino)uracil reductase
MVEKSFDENMMLRCLQLANQALGKTAPNPLVGCVIVKNGEIIGEGFHPQAGQPHAEVWALEQVGEKAEGATVYVNLEPCSHYGRTPPCVDALIKAGVSKVVIGMIDPNPLVAGSGVAKLKAANIEVLVGVESEACQTLNEAFVHRILHHRPFGILKYAMTLDGKIATTTGDSAWVTNPTARSLVHELRAVTDAVIVGTQTVKQDNPYLTSRKEKEYNPLRVIMSRSLDLPLEANLWQIEEAPTVIFTETGANPTLQKHLQARGVEIVEMLQLTPENVMANLYERGLLTVLWECGETLAARAIASGSVQKVWAFIAPKIIGGQLAPGPIGDLGLTEMARAIALEKVNWQKVGDDFLITGYLQRG